MLQWKEFPDGGKLYVSQELEKDPTITLLDNKESSHKISLNEVASISNFSREKLANLQNQVKFLEECKQEGILPNFQVYKLIAKSNAERMTNVLFITCSYNEYMDYLRMFYLSKAEAIFSKMFPSNDWNLINAEITYFNIAQKGNNLMSLENFETSLRKIKQGEYIIEGII